MAKKKSSGKKGKGMNTRNVIIVIVIILIAAFGLAMIYQGPGEEDEEGLGAFFPEAGEEESIRPFPFVENGGGGGGGVAAATCPTAWCRAEKGDAKSCCPAGQKCFKGGYSAWCGPIGPKDCKIPPRTKFCKAAGASDTACCLPDEGCVEEHGYSWCKPKKADCKARFGGEGIPCGDFYCCDGNFLECQGNGAAPDSCTLKTGGKCPTGYDSCNGLVNLPFPLKDYPITICCHIGTCVSSTKGTPTCSDNQPYRD